MYFTRENSQNLRQKRKWALWMRHQFFRATKSVQVKTTRGKSLKIKLQLAKFIMQSVWLSTIIKKIIWQKKSQSVKTNYQLVQKCAFHHPQMIVISKQCNHVRNHRCLERQGGSFLLLLLVLVVTVFEKSVRAQKVA
jgi:hypothetical protein